MCNSHQTGSVLLLLYNWVAAPVKKVLKKGHMLCHVTCIQEAIKQRQRAACSAFLAAKNLRYLSTSCLVVASWVCFYCFSDTYICFGIIDSSVNLFTFFLRNHFSDYVAMLTYRCFSIFAVHRLLTLYVQQCRK